MEITRYFPYENMLNFSFWGDLTLAWHWVFNHELNYSITSSKDQIKFHTMKSLFDHYLNFCSIQIEILNFILQKIF